jgi:hypothetical protein
MVSPAMRLLALALAIGLASSTALAAGGELLDEPSSTIELEYRIYAGGIPLGQVEFNARLRGDSYTASSTLETVGLASAVWKAELEATSYGTIGSDTLHPANYDAFSIHSATRFERQQVTLAYTNGVPSVTPNPPYRDSITVEDEYTMNTFDPVSALVFATTSYRQYAADPCGLTAPVFDGRRSYRIALDMVRRANVNMDSGLYNGPVDICELKFQPVAGADQLVFEDGNVPDVFAWIASAQSTADPQRRYLMPLRIWAETDYGIVVILLTGVHIDGAEITRLN